MERVNKINYYLDIAQAVASRSTCLRRRFGAIIVKNDNIVSTGYNGAPRGRQNCSDRMSCVRDKLGIPRGERYEMCRSVHAEANAIIAASRDSMLGATLFMACTDPKSGEVMGGLDSCAMCKRLLLNAGVEKIIVREDNSGGYKAIMTAEWVKNDDTDGVFGY
ncbi:MAG: dCMP deaminase family protein [Oscillospiraceae bacterium]|nr:dCMP deaminase family protein [Oscillospiraceae bacterium]